MKDANSEFMATENPLVLASKSANGDMKYMGADEIEEGDEIMTFDTGTTKRSRVTNVIRCGKRKPAPIIGRTNV